MGSVAGEEVSVGVVPRAGRACVPSLWLVAGLLMLHQLALTVIHYGLGPALGIDLLSAGSVVVTIVGASAIMLALIAVDLRRHDRAGGAGHPPLLDRSTVGVMLLALGIAQLPLLYLAASGKTVWQPGAGSHLDVGEALPASLSTVSGLGLLAATVVVAPLVEELLYRGYLLGGFLARVPSVGAVVLSALLFVTLHAEAANLVDALCLGIGTAVCAVRTRSILPGLAVHVASNAFGMWYAIL